MDAALVPDVLNGLEIEAGTVSPDADGLHTLYRAWCRSVPFDNVVKRIHLASGDSGPVPNADPDTFFASWLEHGTGGTCWPSTLALHALLVALGFDVRIGSAAMMDVVDPTTHSHGTLLVTTSDDDGGERLWWVDTSMLTDAPVPLRRGEHSELGHPLRPVRVEAFGDLWRVHWFSPALGGEMPCRLLDDDVTIEHCQARYEVSRGFGPFNDTVYSTRNEDDRVRAFAFGELVTVDREGVTREPVSPGSRNETLQTFGYSQEILERLPPDVPKPPPT